MALLDLKAVGKVVEDILRVTVGHVVESFGRECEACAQVSNV